MKHKEMVAFVLLVGCVMAMNVCVGQDDEAKLPAGPLGETRVVVLIAPKDFKDVEYAQVVDALKQQGARIIVASAVLASQDVDGNRVMPQCTGVDGLKVTPLVTLQETLEAAQEGGMIDAVVFVGGPGAAKYVESDKALELARIMKKRAKTVAAICIAPAILAKAGILQGRNATAWEEEKKALIDGGANYTGKDVEVDGRIITANGPDASKKFAATLTAALLREANAKAEAAKTIAPAMELVDMGDYDKAQAMLEKAQAQLEKTDPLARLHILMAQIDLYMEDGKIDEALKRLHVLLAAGPDSALAPQAMLKTGILSINKKDYAAAEKTLNALLSTDADPFEEGLEGYYNYRFSAYRLLAETAKQRSDRVKSIEMLLAAINEDFVAFANEDKAKKARDECSTAVTMATAKELGLKEPDEHMTMALNVKTADEYFFKLGMSYLRGGKNDEAEKAFALLRKHYPKSAYIEQIPEAE